jgi:hypothetical protein
MRDTGCRAQVAGYKMQVAGYRCLYPVSCILFLPEVDIRIISDIQCPGFTPNACIAANK